MSAPGYFFCRTFRHYFVGIVLHQATDDLRTGPIFLLPRGCTNLPADLRPQDAKVECDALHMKEPKKVINTLRRGGCFLCRVPGLSEDIPRPLSAS